MIKPNKHRGRLKKHPRGKKVMIKPNKHRGRLKKHPRGDEDTN